MYIKYIYFIYIYMSEKLFIVEDSPVVVHLQAAPELRPLHFNLTF